MNSLNFKNIRSLLFDNRTVRQTIFKNTFWSLLGTGTNKALKAILLIYAARILGATDYGKFSFALAFVALFVIVYDFGLSFIVIREFSREKEDEFYSILSLKILLGLAALVLILFCSTFVTGNPEIKRLIIILGIFGVVESLMTVIFIFFQAKQRMEYHAWLETVQTLAVMAIGFFILLRFPSAENFGYAYLFSSVISLMFAFLFFHLKVMPLKLSWKTNVWRKFLIMAWPLAFNGLFMTICNHIDSVIMGSRGLITETGWYSAAYKVINIAILPAGLISGSFYPVLSKFFKESTEKLQKIWDYQTGAMAILGLPTAAGGIVLAPKIIHFFYGPDFERAVLALQILLVSAGITFISRPFQDILLSCNQQKKFFWVTLIGSSINIVLNLLLIPKFSLYGAAVATVVTFFLMFLLLIFFVKKFTPVNPLNRRFFLNLVTAFICSIFMWLIISRFSIYNLNIFFSVFIGIMTYTSFMIFFAKNF